MKANFVVPTTDESTTTFTKGTIFASKFRLEEKIGQGSFGMIFKCISLESQEILAIKLEKQTGRHASMLIREIKVMNEMKSDRGFARLHSFGKDDEYSEYNYVAMTYLGRNIDSLLKKCSGRFSMQTVVNIADQMISRLEAMHAKNLIHRDIKPENYVIGYGSNFTTVHLIDFGLAKYFKDSNGVHIPFVENKGMIGTARYASINAHQGYEQSRRDDLEALGYVLLYFAKGKLPWSNIYAVTKDEKYEKIKAMKIANSPEQLCENLPQEFAMYFKHVRQLAFEEVPNYAMLKKLFAKIAEDKKIESLVATLDWEQLPDYRQRKKYNTSAPSFASHSKIGEQYMQAQQQQQQQHQQQQQLLQQQHHHAHNHPVSQQVISSAANNKKLPSHMLNSNPINVNLVHNSSQNINTEQQLLLQYGGATTNSNVRLDSIRHAGLKSQQQNTTVHAYHPLNTNPSISGPIQNNGSKPGDQQQQQQQQKQNQYYIAQQQYETDQNEASVHLHLNPANNNSNSNINQASNNLNNIQGNRNFFQNDEPMSNLNALNSQQFLNVPNYEKGTNVNNQSVNSANSGGTSRLNNYMWSDSEDITSDEGIVVAEFISKENQPFHTKNIFDDIRVRSSQIHLDNDALLGNSPENVIGGGGSGPAVQNLSGNKTQSNQFSQDESPNHIKKHNTIRSHAESKQSGSSSSKPEFRKMSTYMGENINDLVTEAEREVKVLEVKMAFKPNSKHE